MSTPAHTIDDVIDRLTGIIDWAKVNPSRLGYFAALYRKVTVQVQQGIHDGVFDDGPRMERLDVLFANRYLDAFDAYRDGGAPSQSWQVAFEMAPEWWPIVLQHLLLGMNAHINLDLGIAAARTVPPENLPDLQGDFNKINTILASLVDDVKEELSQVWITLRLLDRFLGNVEDGIINFSMKKARDHAWTVAERLAPLPEVEQAREIAKLDGDVVELARLVRSPGVFVGTVNKIIRLGERGTIPKIIGILE